MCQHFGERKPDQEDFCKDARLSLTISVGADEFAMDKYAWPWVYVHNRFLNDYSH
jgi:hypothetical protein